MAQSRQCLRCAYSGRMHNGIITNYKTDISCDYFMRTGRLDDKGKDKDNCLLFECKKGKRKPNMY